MAETETVNLEHGGIWSYQEQRGLNRKFPMNGVPKVAKRALTPKEVEILSNPMIKNAPKEEAHGA